MPLPSVDVPKLATVAPVDPAAVPSALKAVRDDAETRLAAIEAGTQSLTQLLFPAPTELTISGAGGIATTQVTHKVDTNADAATDDLDTITGVANGELVLLRPENAARNVVIRDTGGGTGNIRTPHGKSITLKALTDWALGIGDGTNVTIVAFRTAAGDGGGAGAIIGLLTALSTTEKGTIVGAINEVFDGLTDWDKIKVAIAAADTAVDVNGQEITDVGAPQAGTSAARKQDVDAKQNALQTGQVTLVAGTVTVNAGITITANSKVFVQLVTPGAGASGTRYKVHGLVEGGPGVGAFSVTAVDSNAGDNIVNTDVSVLDYVIVN